MTFPDIDALMAYFDQFAADRLRECQTSLILRGDQDLDDDLGETLDGLREIQAQVMAAWRVRARREFAGLLTFPVTVTWRNARESTCTAKVRQGADTCRRTKSWTLTSHRPAMARG